MTAIRPCRRATFGALAALAGLLAAVRPLEAATFFVTKTADTNDGTCNADCSLREALVAANATAAMDTINFSIAGTFSILGTALPTITNPVLLAGTSAPGYVTMPVVRLDGNGLPAGSSGLSFGAGATSSSVSALAITGFPAFGIEIGSANTAVTRSFLGVALDGTTDAGNGLSGIRVAAANCVLGNTNVGNVISGNGERGILVQQGANGTTIRGNRIGTNAAGTVGLPNDGNGIYGTGGSSVFIGGASAGQGNVISGNGGVGIDLDNTSLSWSILGNLIGVNAAGTGALGNSQGGVRTLTNGHLIGGATALARNVISANGTAGIVIGNSADGVTILGNYIGTTASGDAALAGQPIGIRVFGTNGTIGGTSAAARNVISGNSSSGISLESPAAGWVVSANYIGLSASGATAVGNGGGVALGGSDQILGGFLAGERNVISGNPFGGIAVSGTGHQILGNYIGTNPAGTAAIAGNAQDGIRVLNGSAILIGSAGAGGGNLLSGNGANGISTDDTSSGVNIRGNWIGTDASGSVAIPNSGGVVLRGQNHVVGGADAASGNLISGNSFDGVALFGSGHQVRGNRIGTQANGNVALGNAGNGVRILDATGVVIGGSEAGEGNLISGNTGDGVATDTGSSLAVIQGNRIGTDLLGSAAIPNASGVSLAGGNHLLGGASAAAGNQISGNTNQGVVLGGTASTVSANLIGTTANGLAALANGSYGIRVYGATNCEIGGPTAAEGNVISGNPRGVSFEQSATGNRMRNNVVGLALGATADLPDNGAGVEIFSPGNIIGEPGAGNVIAGWSYQGILLDGAEATGNLIQGNWIGTNSALAAGLGNFQLGILVTDAHDNTIGGTDVGAGNVIANNGFIGLWVEHGQGIEISGNSFFGNALLGIDIAEQGVVANDGGDGDGGGNRGLNYPLLWSAIDVGGSTTVQGMLTNEPDTQYRVELFTSPSCGSTGFGEGRTFLGSKLVTTGPSGQAALSAAFPTALVDSFLTATVTDPAGNSSEFSPCAAAGVANPGKLQFYRNGVLSYEGVLPTGDAVITRSQGLSGTVSATFTTSNDSAIAGQDYTDSDQVVTFGPWEVVKTVKIPILFDPAVEPDPEFADLALASPTGGATLGLAASDLYIFDNTPAFPGIRVDDAFVEEGDAGTQAMQFKVHLSPSDHPVTVSYLTVDGSAVGGEDFLVATGTLAFPASPSEQELTLGVQVFGDTDVESGETVLVEIGSVAAGGMWVAYDTVGEGEIRNDDWSSPPPPNVVFADGFELGSTALWSHTAP